MSRNLQVKLFDLENRYKKLKRNAQEIIIKSKAYDEIYPNVRTLITTIMVNAGLPPIVIPKVKMDDSNIKLAGNEQENNGQLYS